MSDSQGSPIVPPAVGAVQSYVEGTFGGPTTEQDSNPSTSASAVKIIDNDPDRVALQVFNLGSEDVYLAFTNDVSATKGFYLAKSGGFLGMDVTEDFTLVARELWAVSPSGASTLYVVQTRRYSLT